MLPLNGIRFPENWEIDIKPTLIDHIVLPQAITAHQSLGVIDLYKIVSQRPYEQRHKIIANLVDVLEASHTYASTSSHLVAIPLHYSDIESIIVAYRYRCKHCNKISQNIATFFVITILMHEALATRYETKYFTSNSIPTLSKELEPTHKVLSWHPNAFKDTGEITLLLQQMLQNLLHQVNVFTNSVMVLSL